MGDDTDKTDEIRQQIEDSDSVREDRDADRSDSPLLTLDQNEGEIEE
ncbi:hypothetical protein [Natrinema sp. DC36]|nr:hypothetical protein [Natrinema sp. DC36]